MTNEKGRTPLIAPWLYHTNSPLPTLFLAATGLAPVER
jgi:hypothetical protein